MDISESGLHIINNPSAAASWGQAFHKTDRLLVQQDMLSCGPTPFCQSLAEWENIRVAYLKQVYSDWPNVNFSGLTCDLLTNAERLRNYDSIYIWVGTGIEDQFLIPFVIYLADRVGADTSKIKLIQFEKYSDKNFLVRSTGELNPERMRDYPLPLALTQTDVDNFRAAWNAITSNNPNELEKFLSNGKKEFPYLLESIQHFTRRYPQRKSGLSLCDWKLIQNTQEYGSSVVRIIGYTFSLDFADNGNHVDTLYLFYRLKELASRRYKVPLIELHSKQKFMNDTTVTLTEFGKAVVNGEASSYPTNAIDEWIGGVHLSSEKGNLWFHDDGKIVPANNFS